MKDNRGLTLVELIIAITILTIVGSAIAGFLITGIRSYASTSSEVNLQYEAQLVMNQVGDLLIDASESITYDDSVSGNKTLDIYTSYHPAENDSSVSYRLDRITWQQDQSRVYYEKFDTDETGAITGAGSGAQVLSEYVESFDVDVSSVEETNQILISLGMKNRNHTYQTSNSITLRNVLAVNRKSASEDEDGDDSGGGSTTDDPATVIVSLSPDETYAMPGTAIVYTAAVKGGSDEDNDLTWSVSGAASASTEIDQLTHKLTIGESENASLLTVTATTPGGVSGTAVVHVRQVTGVVIDYNSGVHTLAAGDIFTMSVKVSGVNVTDSEADQAVNWVITGGKTYVSQTGDNTFSLSTETPEGQTFSLQAFSVLDTQKKYGSNVYTFTTNDDGRKRIVSFDLYPAEDDYDYEPDSDFTLKLKITGVNLSDEDLNNYKWKVVSGSSYTSYKGDNSFHIKSSATNGDLIKISCTLTSEDLQTSDKRTAYFSTYVKVEKKVTDVVIKEDSENTYLAGSTFALKATVTGKFLSSSDKNVDWSIREGGRWLTVKSSTYGKNVTYLIADSAPKDTQIVIRATSSLDSEVYDEITLKVMTTNITYLCHESGTDETVKAYLPLPGTAAFDALLAEQEVDPASINYYNLESAHYRSKSWAGISGHSGDYFVIGICNGEYWDSHSQKNYYGYCVAPICNHDGWVSTSVSKYILSQDGTEWVKVN